MNIAQLLALSLPLLGAACSSNGPPVATGPLRPLNPAHWTPTPAEIAGLPAVAGGAHP